MEIFFGPQALHQLLLLIGKLFRRPDIYVDELVTLPVILHIAQTFAFKAEDFSRLGAWRNFDLYPSVNRRNFYGCLLYTSPSPRD